MLPFRGRGTYAYLVAAVASRLKIRGTAPIQIGANRLRMDLGDRWQSYMLLRCYEPDIEGIIRGTLGPGDVYVDVGAQLGYTMALAAQQVGSHGRLLAVEPDPRLAERLKENLAATMEDGSATIVTAACSDGGGNRLVLRIHDTLGWSLIDPLADPEAPLPPNSVSVPSVTLDDLLDAQGIGTVHLLKIDVEGHEISVLNGLSRHLERKQVQVICVENNPYLLEQSGFSSLHLHAIFAHHGYLGCHPDGEPIRAAALHSCPLGNFFYFADTARYTEVFRRQYAGPDGTEAAIEDAWREATDEGLAVSRRNTIKRNRIIQKVRNREMEGGIRMAEEFLAENPRDLAMRGHLGYWYACRGNYTKAEQQYDEILRVTPEDPAVQQLLIEVRSKMASAENTSDAR